MPPEQFLRRTLHNWNLVLNNNVINITNNCTLCLAVVDVTAQQSLDVQEYLILLKYKRRYVNLLIWCSECTQIRCESWQVLARNTGRCRLDQLDASSAQLFFCTNFAATREPFNNTYWCRGVQHKGGCSALSKHSIFPQHHTQHRSNEPLRWPPTITHQATLLLNNKQPSPSYILIVKLM